MCPTCKSKSIRRSRRHGITDKICARLGYWPYRCQDCGSRFRLPIREYSAIGCQSEWTTPRKTAASHAGVSFRTHPQAPVAKVLLKAESQAQLDRILMALEKAVRSNQRISKTTAG